MKKDVQELWINDLRTAKAVQGQGYLRQWNDETQKWEYCCLGRLCELSGLGEWVDDGTRGGRTVSAYLGVTQYLPDEVANWAGLTQYDPAGDTAQAKFAEMNDEFTSFADIATAIPDVLDECSENE